MPRMRVALIAAASLLVATLLTFPLSQFVVHSRDLFFIAAVIVVSRYGNVVAGLIVSLFSVLVFDWFFDSRPYSLDLTAGGMMRTLVFASVSLLIASIEQHRRYVIQSLAESNRTVRSAREQIRTLHGLLPICMYCRQIRTDEETWIGLEEYVRKHSEARFSHGVCPVCYRKHYPDLYDQTSGPMAS